MDKVGERGQGSWRDRGRAEGSHISARETWPEKNKMCLSRRGFYKHTTVQNPPEPPWMCQVSNLSKIESESRSLFPRTHADPQAGPGAPFLGCAHVELPLPFFRSAQPPFLTAPVPQHHVSPQPNKPRYPFSPPPDPPFPEKQIFVFKKNSFFYGQLLGEDRCLARFLSSIPAEDRTNADVNTGNDTTIQTRE